MTQVFPTTPPPAPKSGCTTVNSVVAAGVTA
jgi:hypothetical protein